MSKNQLMKNKPLKKEFVDISTILKDKHQRGKLQNYIDETIRCKQKILDERESIKALRDSAVEELNIEPKLYNALVGLFFNNNFEEKREEIEKLESAIHILSSNNLLEE